MQKLILAIVIFFISSVAISQTTERGKITVKVTGEQQKPIEGATAELLELKILYWLRLRSVTDRE